MTTAPYDPQALAKAAAADMLRWKPPTTPRKPMQKTIEDVATAAGVLDQFKAAVAGRGTFYLKARVDGYMPLVIEVIPGETGPEVSVCHYYKQHGDTMRDPEYVFETRNWRPVEFTQDNLGLFHRARPGYYLARGAIEFCGVWAKNIRHQGFADPKSATYETEA